MSKSSVRDWLKQHSGFPAAYTALGLTWNDVDVDHLLPEDIGGLDHPFNYFILVKSLNRGWNAFWTREKKAYLGKTNYNIFRLFLSWSRSAAKQQGICYTSFEAAWAAPATQ